MSDIKETSSEERIVQISKVISEGVYEPLGMELLFMEMGDTQMALTVKESLSNYRKQDDELHKEQMRYAMDTCFVSMAHVFALVGAFTKNHTVEERLQHVGEMANELARMLDTSANDSAETAKHTLSLVQ